MTTKISDCRVDTVLIAKSKIKKWIFIKVQGGGATQHGGGGVTRYGWGRGHAVTWREGSHN